MTIAGSQYEIDFTGLSDVSPWSDAEWVNLENSAQINTGGIRATGFVFTTIYRDVELDDDIVTAKISIVSNAAATYDPIGAALFVASGASENYGYILYCSSTTGILYRRDAATGVGASLGSFTLDGENGDEYELHYDKTDGTLYVYENDVEVFSVTDTTYDDETFRAGMYFNPENNNGRRIGAFGSEGVASEVSDAVVTKLQITHNGVTEEQYFTSTPSGDDFVLTVDGPIIRTTLPPIGEVTVEGLDDEDTIIFSESSNLVTPTGTQAAVVASPVVNAASLAGLLDVSSDPLEDDDQIQIRHNVVGLVITVNPDTSLSFNIPGPFIFEVRAWQFASNTYSPWQSIDVDKDLQIKPTVPTSITGLARRRFKGAHVTAAVINYVDNPISAFD